MIKTAFILSLFLFLLSCKKEKGSADTPETYGEKMVGIWICDSITNFLPDSNDSMIYHNTDTIPKTYVFVKSSGAPDMYKWNDVPVKINESEGSIYREGPLGDFGDLWYITYIDANKCVLRLDKRGMGSYIISEHWYYLTR